VIGHAKAKLKAHYQHHYNNISVLLL